MADKQRFLSELALKRQKDFQRELIESGVQITDLQFDEMESFERTKCLPLSIPLAVHPVSRKILAIGVASMPAKGPLAAISLKKYGPRKDDREKEALRLFADLVPLIHPNVTITSDQNPRYPGWIRDVFPGANHIRIKGRDACVVGQGELKKVGFDPIFALNHTAAMIRANVSRLVRRTWCTTKNPERLREHLLLYMDYHNRVLTRRWPAFG